MLPMKTNLGNPSYPSPTPSLNAQKRNPNKLPYNHAQDNVKENQA